MNSTLDTAGQGAMYGGAAATGLFWGLSVSDIAVILSAFVAFLGFLVHAWATIRKDQREQAQHNAVMLSGIVTHAQIAVVQESADRIEAKVDEA